MSEVMTGRRARSHETAAEEARVDPWADSDVEESQRPIQPLTASEAQAVLAGQVRVSPWRVVATQGVVGLCLACMVALTPWGGSGAVSVLYGAAVVVVPAVLMARGLTSLLSRASPTTSAVSFMAWEMVKIAVSVLMLALAPKVVQPLNWLALLLSLVVCMKVYWVALLWRGNRKHSVNLGPIKNGS